MTVRVIQLKKNGVRRGALVEETISNLPAEM
jgi:hypothetical protein